MNRTARDRTADGPRPVTRIELNEDKLPLRLILVGLLLVVGVVLIAVGVRRWLSAETGWQTVEVTSRDPSCAPEFTLWYELGASGLSATAENKQLNLAYTQAAIRGYKIFHAHERFPGLGNLASLSDSPNQPVKVEPELYRALEEIAASGSRLIYLAPVYEMYNSLFHSLDAAEAAVYDPTADADLGAWCARAAAYAADPAHISLELTAPDRATLRLSEEYAAFLRESGVADLLDLFWMKNAFLADYLADALAAEGFTNGCLTSFDGFSRNLGGRDEEFGLSVYDQGYPAAELRYRGAMSLVSLHDYPVNDRAGVWYFQMADGWRHPFVDSADGVCRSAYRDLLGYSTDRRCAETALALADVFIGQNAGDAALLALRDRGIETVLCRDHTILTTGEPQLAAVDGSYEIRRLG